MKILKGFAYKFGDNIDTDVIIPARYCVSFDPKTLGRHAMEGLDGDFSMRIKPGDFIVAGANFGCGSSREQAPLALKGCGLSGVIAESFARIFYRNAINVGLPIFESKEAARNISHGDKIEVFTEKGLIVNRIKDKKFEIAPYPEFLREIIAVGGLQEYVRRVLAKKARSQAR